MTHVWLASDEGVRGSIEARVREVREVWVALHQGSHAGTD